MLTINSVLRIPGHVMTTTVDGDVVLLDTRVNKYFALKQTGSDVWTHISEGKSLVQIHAIMLEKYDVASARLEQDILEVVTDLLNHQLVEIL